MSTRVEVHNEVRAAIELGWQLCFQWCTYHYPAGERPENVDSDQSGYRFIWETAGWPTQRDTRTDEDPKS